MVNLKEGDISALCRELEGKRLVCFGCGRQLEMDLALFAEYCLEDKIAFLLDNDPKLWNRKRIFHHQEYDVIALDKGIELLGSGQYVLLITNYFHYMDIVHQLDEAEGLDQLDVYVSGQLYEGSAFGEKDFSERVLSNAGNGRKIPKVIHYCWFGGGKMPELYLKCMESWRKYCPDYKIVCWDEENFDLKINEYTSQAYQYGKWAFVSDVARLYAVYSQGGVYLDCDVELLRPLDDLLEHEMYCGFEDHRQISFGLGFGARRGHPYLGELLRLYEQLCFVREDGSLDTTPCPYYQTLIARKFGLKLHNCFQRTEHITFFPSEAFAPVSYLGEKKLTDHTYSIHHYSASWCETDNDAERRRMKKAWMDYRERVGTGGGNN